MPTYNPRFQCAGKQRFTSRREALTLLNRPERKRLGKPAPALGRLKPYACQHCGAWHLGHTPPKKGRRDPNLGREPEERRIP
jgi:hypothetical protein